MIGKIQDCLATVVLVFYSVIDSKTDFWTLYARAHALSYISVSGIQLQDAVLIISNVLNISSLLDLQCVHLVTS